MSALEFQFQRDAAEHALTADLAVVQRLRDFQFDSSEIQSDLQYNLLSQQETELHVNQHIAYEFQRFYADAIADRRLGMREGAVAGQLGMIERPYLTGDADRTAAIDAARGRSGNSRSWHRRNISA